MTRRLTTAVMLVMVALPIGGVLVFDGAPLSGQAVEGPPPEHVFVAMDEVTEPSQLLARIRDSLIRAISEADLAPAGYPKPCQITREPDPDRPGGYLVFCIEQPPGLTEPAPTEPELTDVRPIEPDGILFDSEGHHMQLSIVDFADSRVYLTRVYLVPRMPYPELESMARLETPRVVLHTPHIPDHWHPDIWGVIERGLEASGAKEVDLGPIAPEPGKPR
jgi:hypothetical protein